MCSKEVSILNDLVLPCHSCFYYYFWNSDPLMGRYLRGLYWKKIFRVFSGLCDLEWKLRDKIAPFSPCFLCSPFYFRSLKRSYFDIKKKVSSLSVTDGDFSTHNLKLYLCAGFCVNEKKNWIYRNINENISDSHEFSFLLH